MVQIFYWCPNHRRMQSQYYFEYILEVYEHLKSIKKNKGNIKIDSINDELHK